MAPYKYSNLNTETNEIRLLMLLPGAFGDPLQAQITHAALSVPAERKSKRISIEELQKFLPPSWVARETVEGRYLFEVQGTDKSSWMHPDPDFDYSLYEGFANEPDLEFEPKYEALSHVWGASTDNQETLFLESSASATGKVHDMHHSASIKFGIRTPISEAAG
jgi:hypothetical protein